MCVCNRGLEHLANCVQGGFVGRRVRINVFLVLVLAGGFNPGPHCYGLHVARAHQVQVLHALPRQSQQAAQASSKPCSYCNGRDAEG